ncbi:hypothetical protein MFLO_15573 [Listeria floridensis FSL S10-1187]|uniref:Transmembrane Fragile-X-F protein n=1 Tax=Listeria floridensis FSL S10-1187 TaxID=1265817 RepID=A0ABN0RBF9_9LIST|nr:hypothetical protein [Listeria floridensis]EUJ25246.1 hypothetical protein MFLO_15573 [Listeria floridensis FSL S10-1187]
MGILELLTIILVICKLAGVISWSWWLVFLPEIIALLSYIVFVFIYKRVYKKVEKEVDKWYF